MQNTNNANKLEEFSEKQRVFFRLASLMFFSTFLFISIFSFFSECFSEPNPFTVDDTRSYFNQAVGGACDLPHLLPYVPDDEMRWQLPLSSGEESSTDQRQDFCLADELASIEVSREPSTTLTPVDLYEEISATVYALRPANVDWRFYGSAIAVSPRLLLTTCQFLRGAKTAWIHQESALIDSVTLIWGDSPSGRCIFRTDFIDLESFAKIRSYSSFKVSEKSIAVGKPAGYNFFVSEGVITQKFNKAGVRNFKTSAILAPGSFGSGIFDRKGFLLGISMKSVLWHHYQDETIAISAEEFVVRLANAPRSKRRADV